MKSAEHPDAVGIVIIDEVPVVIPVVLFEFWYSVPYIVRVFPVELYVKPDCATAPLEVPSEVRILVSAGF